VQAGLVAKLNMCICEVTSIYIITTYLLIYCTVWFIYLFYLFIYLFAFVFTHSYIYQYYTDLHVIGTMMS